MSGRRERGGRERGVAAEVAIFALLVGGLGIAGLYLMDVSIPFLSEKKMEFLAGMLLTAAIAVPLVVAAGRRRV